MPADSSFSHGQPPELTVAICAHNAETRIPMVLESLAAARAETDFVWELLVVDNASTDRTSAIAEALCAKHRLPLRLLQEPEAGLANARRTAACAARAEILCFLDDDNIVAPDYLKSALAFMHEHPGAGLAGALVEPVFEDPAACPADFQQQFAGLLSMYDQGPSARRLLVPQDPSPVGAGLVGRTALFRLAFNELGSLTIGRRGNSLAGGEDFEAVLLLQHLGWEIWYAPAMRLGHFVPTRKLTRAYREKWMIDTCRCHAWLRVLWGQYPNPSRFFCLRQCWRLRLQGAIWGTLAMLPNRLHRRLREAGLWRSMFFSMAAGWKTIYDNFDRAQSILQYIRLHKRSGGAVNAEQVVSSPSPAARE